MLAGLIGVSAAADDFPTPTNSERRGEPMPPAEALANFQLPSGFQASLFAAEPDVRQPIAMAFDPRGRLWVAENYTYAETGVNFATNFNDRVLILEDADHDGRFDQRTVFWDQAKLLTSVEVGLGGVFLMCPPNLLFVPDRNGDDQPDGPPEVLLDGFNTTTGNRHTFANGLRWGPDGWLWGRVGISSGAKIGRPGQAEAGRVEMRGGIWRYHPARRVFEAVSHGTTNPWGLDWNEVGEPFFINTVIGHLWHAIPGAHFQRMHGEDVLPRSYALIGQHADHFHFDTGAGWQKSRAAHDGSAFAAGSDDLGGGHAHCGLMIYQGDNWPAEMRGKVFTINLHGRRVNVERLERRGSGYVGRHEPDLFRIGDPWFRGIDLLQGPDGGVFLADWSDTGECHEHDGVHRLSGRIYKLTHGTPKQPAEPDLTKLETAALVTLLFDRNEWLARQARRVLTDRAAAGRDAEAARQALFAEFSRRTDTHGRLRALWALNALGAADANWLRGLLAETDEHVRSWAVRLLADEIAFEFGPGVTGKRITTHAPPESRGRLIETTRTLVQMAKTERSALVRLYLAAALQKLPVDAGTAVALSLLMRGEDANDHNVPLMLWYGLAPLIETNPGVTAGMTRRTPHRLVRQLIARALAEGLETNPKPIESLLREAIEGDDTAKVDTLRGMTEGLRGWRKATPPSIWGEFLTAARNGSDPEIAERLRDLNVLFRDGRALDELRQVVADAGAGSANRRQALKTLVDSGADNLAPLLKKMVGDSTLRATALAGLLQLGDAGAPGLALGNYQWLGLEERPAVLNALTTRTAAARELLQALAEGRIPRGDFTPFHARQIASLNDAELTAQLEKAWGTVRATDADRRNTIERLRGELTPARLQSANLGRGRHVFVQACAPCHRLYGEGGQVGPDLTGSGRTDLGYLLENTVDPGAVVPADFRMTVAMLKDGRVLNGVLRAQNERTVTIENQTERVTIERSEVTSLETSPGSMMPDGLLESLPPDDARDLLAYLMHPRQVMLPEPQ